MKHLIALIIFTASLSLIGCGGADGEVHAFNYTPELHRFDVVDSYGIDTAKPGDTPLAINPYLYNGLFDLSWQVNSLDDYRINVRINDYPSVSNSYLVYSQVCGLGRACDQGGGVICEYTSDLFLSCNNNRPTDIAPLFKAVPQKLYLILELCDQYSSYCTYDYYPVLME